MLNALNLHALVDKFFELSILSAGSWKLEAVTMIVVIDLSKAHAQRVGKKFSYTWSNKLITSE